MTDQKSDRELLELAAKAEGRDLSCAFWGGALDGFYWLTQDDDLPAIYWNPRKDDGDALRLALALDMVLDCENCCATAEKGKVRGNQWFGGVPDSPHAGGGFDHNSEKPKIMRLAIVRAAAAIGEAL